MVRPVKYTGFAMTAILEEPTEANEEILDWSDPFTVDRWGGVNLRRTAARDIASTVQGSYDVRLSFFGDLLTAYDQSAEPDAPDIFLYEEHKDVLEYFYRQLGKAQLQDGDPGGAAQTYEHIKLLVTSEDLSV